MFDPNKAALLILSKKHGMDEGDDAGDEQDGMGKDGPDALKAAFKAMQDGDFDVAYDAFRAAVASCDAEGDDDQKPEKSESY